MDTLHWIQWLLERGWTLRALPSAVLRASIWEWRTPEGVSGNDYQSTDFYGLPPAVEAHILEHAIMTGSREDGPAAATGTKSKHGR